MKQFCAGTAEKVSMRVFRAKELQRHHHRHGMLISCLPPHFFPLGTIWAELLFRFMELKLQSPWNAVRSNEKLAPTRQQNCQHFSKALPSKPRTGNGSCSYTLSPPPVKSKPSTKKTQLVPGSHSMLSQRLHSVSKFKSALSTTTCVVFLFPTLLSSPCHS